MQGVLSLPLSAVAALFLLLNTARSRAEETLGPLSGEERAAFSAQLRSLQDRIPRLAHGLDALRDRWADAQIFLKGVVWALDFGPVTDARSREWVRQGLLRARERIDALTLGKAPWSERRGRSVRGFVSEVDGSVQPYGLVVPAGYDPAKPMRLDVVLHGSAPATGMGELQFIRSHDLADDWAVIPRDPR
jgi:hypothetical protein